MFLFWLGARRPWGFPWLERRPGANPSNRIGPAVSSAARGNFYYHWKNLTKISQKRAENPLLFHSMTVPSNFGMNSLPCTFRALRPQHHRTLLEESSMQKTACFIVLFLVAPLQSGEWSLGLDIPPQTNGIGLWRTGEEWGHGITLSGPTIGKDDTNVFRLSYNTETQG